MTRASSSKEQRLVVGQLGRPSKFIKGTENTGATWIGYLNICGDASIVGCFSSTPVCLVDGTSSFSMGAPNWVFGIYYDPTKGPLSAPIPNGGVVVTANGGTACGPPVNAPRKSILFLQCDPNVNQPPTTALIQESDPSDPLSTPTPCVYYWLDMQYKGFCPLAKPPAPSMTHGTVFQSSMQVGPLDPNKNYMTSMTVVTTSPLPFLQAGSTCAPFSPNHCSLAQYSCSLSSTFNYTIFAAVNVTQVSLTGLVMKASWTSVEPSSMMMRRKKMQGSDCQDVGAGFVSTNGDNALMWNLNANTSSWMWTLSRGDEALFALQLARDPATKECVTCKSRS